jgi:acyl-CoA synthetase (AMP-forming)/AMP-acid ligase II
MEFKPIASSSEGCAYLLTSNGLSPLLIDCGVRFDSIQQATGFRLGRELAGRFASAIGTDLANALDVVSALISGDFSGAFDALETLVNDALSQGAGKTFTPASVGPDDIAVLQYTGGTTGVSKGAVLLHRCLVANILQSEAWYQPALKKIPKGEQIVTVCALPLYHIFGFNTNMMLGLRMGGCNILIPNARDIGAIA